MPRLAIGHLYLTVAVLMCAAVARAQEKQAAPGKADPPAATNPAFEKLKTLAGEWVMAEEPKEKSAKGDKPDEKPALIYKVTAAGSVVMEHMFPGTDHEMVTMYHLDGADLLLTHYCAVGNQPRMKLEKSADPNKLVFKFTGGTNLDPAKDGHMHDATFTFVDADHLRQEWTFWKDGKAGETEKFELKRKK